MKQPAYREQELPEPWRCLQEKRGLTALEKTILIRYRNHIRSGRKHYAAKTLRTFQEHAAWNGC